MDTAPRHRLRLPIILIINFLVFGIMFACCNPATTPPGASISICAIDSARAGDFPEAACGSGAFVAQHGNANLQLHALDKNGHPLTNSQLAITIKGANTASATVTTDSNGNAQYTYQGGHLGTDTVSVTLSAGGANTARQKSAVIHWISTGHSIHPIVWVHGIREDATDFAHELNGTPDGDQSSDSSEQTWTGLIGALTTTYDASAMQAFCYVDDTAWTHTPSGCSSAESPQCSSSADCVSQSSIDANAVALAQVILHLSQHFANKKVTLIGYSMGGAIMRTMLAGCLNSRAITSTDQQASDDEAACAQATSLIDHVFILNGAQEGSWLLTAKRGLDPETLSGDGIPSLANSPFTTVLPLIESSIYAKLKDQLGLDLNGAAEQDLTPQSQNITLHNSVQPLPGPDFYSFYGDIQLGV